MQADDDGVVEAFTVMRTTGANEDDLKVLVSKGFVAVLNEDLVSYILDWSRNNLIKKDRYNESVYRKLLVQFRNGTQTEPDWNQDGTQTEPQVRLGKGRLGQGSLDEDRSEKSQERKNQDSSGEDDASTGSLSVEEQAAPTEPPPPPSPRDDKELSFEDMRQRRIREVMNWNPDCGKQKG